MGYSVWIYILSPVSPTSSLFSPFWKAVEEGSFDVANSFRKCKVLLSSSLDSWNKREQGSLFKRGNKAFLTQGGMKYMWAVCFLVWMLQTSEVAGNSTLHQLTGVSWVILMYWGQDLPADLSKLLNYAGFSGRWLLQIIFFRSQSRHWFVLRLIWLG